MGGGRAASLNLSRLLSKQHPHGAPHAQPVPAVAQFLVSSFVNEVNDNVNPPRRPFQPCQ